MSFFKKSFFCLAVLAAAPFSHLFAVAPGITTQKIEIKNAGTGAKIEPLPLYNGAEWALTCRWDDGPKSDFPMADIMDKHGFKGTFFVTRGGHGAEKEKALIARGHAVQSHSINHPTLPFCSYPMIWRELLKSKILVETRTDCPVNVFAFPGNCDTNAARESIRRDIYDMILRAGYTGVVMRRLPNEDFKDGLSGYCPLPGDGAPVEKDFAEILKDPAARATDPIISWTYHAWAYDKGNLWSLIDAQLKDHAGVKNYWYCAQNDYAAYRWQLKNFKLEPIVTAASGIISYELSRPAAAVAGGNVPLSFKLSSSFAPEVLIDGKSAALEKRGDNDYVFSVPYPAEAAGPSKIDALFLADGKAQSFAKFPQLSGSLSLSPDQNILTVTLKNDGPDLRDVLLTLRLPFPSQQGVFTASFPRVSSSLRESFPIPWGERLFRELSEPVIIAAQLDFQSDSGAGRVYLVRETGVAYADSPAQYFQNHAAFWPLNGMTPGEISAVMKTAVENPGAKIALSSGKTLSWAPASDKTADYPDGIGLKDSGSLILTCLSAPSACEIDCQFGGVKRLFWVNGKAQSLSEKKIRLSAGKNYIIFPLIDKRADFRLLAPGSAVFETPEINKTEVAAEGKSSFVSPEIALREWLVTGPFPNPGERPNLQSFNKDFLLPAGGEAAANPRAGDKFSCDGKDYVWSRLESNTDFIDLKKYLAAAGHTVLDKLIMYAFAEADAEKDMDILISLGSDDGYKLYVNGELIASARVFRGAYPYQETYAARLKKGSNRILIKMEQDIGGFGFYAHLSSADGISPLEIKRK